MSAQIQVIERKIREYFAGSKSAKIWLAKAIKLDKQEAKQ